jgi:hypothetical protein
VYRPGTSDLFALVSPLCCTTPPPAERGSIIELGTPGTGANVLRTVHPYGPGDAQFFFRTDGSAIVVNNGDLNNRSGVKVVDPATGASILLPVEPVGIQDVIAAIGPGTARATASPAPSAQRSGSPLPTQPPNGFATAEEAADAVKRALEGPDGQLLARLMRPSGWYAQWLIDRAKTDPMTYGDALGWVTSYEKAKRTVDARPIYDTDPQHPLGEKYVRSMWIDFGGYPEQKADVMLGRDSGRWYWTSVLLYRPPPISTNPNGGMIDGYATLVGTGDGSFTVKFRTVGARCCTDQSWDGKTVVLRPDANMVWFRADGTRAPTLAATGATVGSDVWVQFTSSTLAADGSYRVVSFAKMYP